MAKLRAKRKKKTTSTKYEFQDTGYRGDKSHIKETTTTVKEKGDSKTKKKTKTGFAQKLKSGVYQEQRGVGSKETTKSKESRAGKKRVEKYKKTEKGTIHAPYARTKTKEKVKEKGVNPQGVARKKVEKQKDPYGKSKTVTKGGVVRKSKIKVKNPKRGSARKAKHKEMSAASDYQMKRMKELRDTID